MAYALTNADVTPESLRSVLPLINWDKIAAMYLPGRSGAECESRWLNCDDPLINQNAWTKGEETRLLLVVQEKGLCNWINIAATLGTQRTPFQCLVRYQRSLNPHIINKAWTKEEDLRLKAAVETFGDNWQLVSSKLDGRTGSQCSNRWRKTLNPERTGVGRWSLEEDKCLMVAVKLFGSCSWCRIAQFVPGRTQSQCRERWRDVLDPELDHGAWRPEEDSKLLDAVSKMGTAWSKIALLIPHRSDNMCMSRWKLLCQDKLPALQAAKQIKQTILQSNFVDREKERPAIGPDDLMTLVHTRSDRHAENTTRGGSEKQMVEAVAVSDGLSNSSKCCNRSRKKKSTPDNNATVQNIPVGSIPVDNEAVSTELRGVISTDIGAGENRTRESVSPGEEGVVKKRKRAPKSVANEGAIRKSMRGSIPVDNEAVPTELGSIIGSGLDTGPVENRMSEPVSLGEEGVVKRRKRASKSVANEGAVRKGMRGSIPVDNEAVPTELRGIIGSGTEAGENRTSETVSLGEEVVKKRKRASKSVATATAGAVRKSMRGSIPVDNEAVPTELRGIISTGTEAETSRMMDPVSVGEEGVVKKRTRRTNSVDNEGAVRRRSNTVGSEGVARKRMRGSISVDSEAVPVELTGIISTDIDEGTDSMMDPVSVGYSAKKRRCTNSISNEGVGKKTRGCTTFGEEDTLKRRTRGSLFVESKGADTRRKRAATRKSAEDSLMADDIAICIPELDLPSMPSEERAIDDGDLNKGKRKSTPRPKQINMAEGDADRRSTCVRLANCLSFARMNGANRNKT